MSKRTVSVAYRHVDDCRPTGCPGHTMTATLNRTVDRVLLERDGERVAYLDTNEWEAIQQLASELKR
jgi:hypothetical protein